MKKIISRIAFIGVAAMALLTSCVTEDIETSFDLADATCTVHVKVLYALDQSDITGKATISSKYGFDSASGTITIPATNKTIDGQTLTVTVSLPGTDYTDSKDVNIATILPGGVGNYSVVFVLGSGSDIQYKAEKFADMDKGYTAYLTENAHYSHADGEYGWLYNDTEFILTGEVNYELWTGCKIEGYEGINAEETAKVKEFVDTIVENDPLTKTPQVLNITVSAWAAYRAYQVLEAHEYMYNVLKKNKALGTDWEDVGNFSYTEYNGGAAMYTEKANPGHAAHYHYGHGHDSHGTTNNAGGGIVLGE